LEGAAEIEDATFGLLDFMLKSEAASNELILSSVESIRDRFPLMANIVSLAVFVSQNIKRSDSEKLAARISEYRKEIVLDRLETIKKASENILEFEAILTLSNSTSVREAILKAKASGWEGMVLLTESRPQNEGIVLAGELAKAGINVNLAVDACMPDLLDRSEAIFLGADCVTPTFFVNKVGTAIAVEFAKKARKPVYVVADKAKIISDRDFRFIPDDNPPAEIAKSKLPNFVIVNHYFERVKPSGDLRFISGRQAYSPGEVKNILKRT